MAYKQRRSRKGIMKGKGKYIKRTRGGTLNTRQIALSGRSMNIQRPLTSINAKMQQQYAKLVYNEEWYKDQQTTQIIADITARTYRLNSPFDPRFEAGGNSAQGFVGYAYNFAQYEVYGVEVDIEAILTPLPGNVNALGCYQFGVYIANDSGNPTSTSNLYTYGLVNDKEYLTLNAPRYRFKRYFSMAQISGECRGEQGNQATVSNNPINNVLLKIWGYNIANHTTAYNQVQYCVKLTYYTMFFKSSIQD